MNDTDLQSAADEWDWTVVEGQFNKEWDTSIPCQLRFVEETDQDHERFHDALKERGYCPLDSRAARKQEEDKPHYDGEICSKEHYSRIRVLVFRGGMVRLFPHDEYVPTTTELSDIVEALEVGYQAELEHEPIEDTEDQPLGQT